MSVAKVGAKDFLTVPEVAAVFRVSESTVYKLLATGALSRVKVLGATRIPAAEIRAMIPGGAA